MSRVNLTTGAVTTIASVAWVVDVIAESNGTTALVSTGGSIERVNLATGTRTTFVATGLGSCSGVRLETGGTTALIGSSGWTPDQLGRVNLTSGALDVIAGPFFTQLKGMGLDPTGANFYYTDAPSDNGPVGTLFKMPAP